MADHPLRPATDRRLGEPLPHQLANQTRANPLAINLSPKRAHPVLAEISLSYSEPKGMFPRVTHPSATPALLRAFDLHVLSLPPAFVLSQDQTLMFKESIPKSQVHSTRSFHPSSILPDKAKTETLSRNVHSGLSSSWHIPQSRRTRQRTDKPQTPATFLFLPIHLSKNRGDCPQSRDLKSAPNPDPPNPST
ncbi:conserved hypothetical protein [uncultured Pleomorphomonas sp.]|uniref:Uncharacterized protein n=1 Tax=uncultured Pleomorphomonas sp. TaxID=442121 RepID=A0A212L336_9HYPH|nr:conserved hypothetical protein [uncultured Pleomorphomonas sp.]